MTALAGTVGLVTPRYAPAIGGVERHVEMLARGLVRRGVAVEVITADPTSRLPSIEERDGVLVRRFPTMGHDAVYFVAPGLGWWLLHNAGRFALLHAHSYHTPLALEAGLAGWWAGTPLVLTPHYHGSGHSPLRRALHLPYRLAGSWLVRRARRVICVSEAERRQVHRHFGPCVSTVVVPNGVELERPRSARPPSKPSGRVLVLAVGRLERYKQVERVVEALLHLPPEHDLVIVGDGPARLPIEQLASRLGLQARVRLPGQVAREELLDWYRTADVFVSMSQREAFGLTLLEAAVAGCAVVASDIPAHREVVAYAPSARIALVAPKCSPAELARAVEMVAGRERSTDVESWPLPTWDGAVDGALVCYHEALGSHLGAVA